MSLTTHEQPRPQRGTAAAIGILLFLVLVGFGIWAYIARRPEVATVTRHDIAGAVLLNGKVVVPPPAHADVFAPYRAPVAKVYSSVGDHVRDGAVLAELSYPSAQVAYEQARASVKAAETALAGAEKEYSATLNSAQKNLDEARAAERTARVDTTAGASNTETEPAVTVREPAADLAQATATRKEAEEMVTQARAELAANLAPFQQQLEVARTALKEAQSGRKVAMIRAPITGTVMALNVQPGKETGDNRTPVATIVDLSALQVHAQAKPEQATALRRGMPATLTIKELPGQSFTGKLQSITTKAGGPLQGERYVTILAFKNDQGQVKPDMSAAVSVQTGKAHNVLVVPSNAVDHDRGGRPVVKVLRGDTAQTQVVEPGISDGKYTEIKSGLKEGESVEVTPSLLGP
jgi:HlyD family secretion protein